MRFFQNILRNFERLRFYKYLNFPFILLFIFPFYFAYDLYTGNVYFSHNDFPGMYYPFRQWFLERLKNFEFPLWNPYWGTGHEAVIWSTVPIDPYTILELIFKPPYRYFHLIQCIAIVMTGYYVFRKLKFDSWTSVIGSLLFFMSPIVTYWYFEFINTNTFIAHMLVFLFMVKWFETGHYKYVFLTGWSFFFGMFGTKLEFWFFETLFFLLLSVIASFIIGSKKASIKASMIFILWISIFMAILAHSWQINLLLNALNNSGRLGIPHGLYNIFSSEMYKNLYMSIGDSDIVPLIFICILLFISLHSNNRTYRWLFFVCSIVLSILFKLWNLSFLPSFLKSPVMFGGIIATILVIHAQQRKYILSAWILFMLPAYYWCKPLVNLDDTLYLLRIAPVLFQGIWGFLVFMGCLQMHRYRTSQIAYLSILMVFLLETQGQIVLSYLFGYLWLIGRDNYLIDFSFIVIAAFGTTTYFRFKTILLILAPFIIVFAAYNNLYYAAFPQPIPGIANSLLNSKLPYDPFIGVPGLKEIIKKWDYLPYRRVIDPDIENRLPQNQGTFLLERTGNATFYGSMVPKRYNNLINFYKYGIVPQDNVAAYPSVYSQKTISRLPKVNTKGYNNDTIYFMSVWLIPPFELDLLRLLGIDYIITRSERSDTLIPPLVQSLKLRNVMKIGKFNEAELSDTLPRSFFISNITHENLEDFQKNMRPHIELKGAEDSASPGVYIATPASFLRYEPEYVAIQVESPSDGYLVLSDVFHPYWSATVDGNTADIIPAFHAFRAVKVPAGSHEVEFFCRVPYFKSSFIVLLVLTIVSAVFTFRFWGLNFTKS